MPLGAHVMELGDLDNRSNSMYYFRGDVYKFSSITFKQFLFHFPIKFINLSTVLIFLDRSKRKYMRINAA